MAVILLVTRKRPVSQFYWLRILWDNRNGNVEQVEWRVIKKKNYCVELKNERNEWRKERMRKDSGLEWKRRRKAWLWRGWKLNRKLGRERRDRGEMCSQGRGELKVVLRLCQVSDIELWFEVTMDRSTDSFRQVSQWINVLQPVWSHNTYFTI